MIAPEFLDLEEVLEIHALQLNQFGGIAGVRDRGLLESAVEPPRATAFGEGSPGVAATKGDAGRQNAHLVAPRLPRKFNERWPLAGP